MFSIVEAFITFVALLPSLGYKLFLPASICLISTQRCVKTRQLVVLLPEFLIPLFMLS